MYPLDAKWNPKARKELRIVGVLSTAKAYLPQSSPPPRMSEPCFSVARLFDLPGGLQAAGEDFSRYMATGTVLFDFSLGAAYSVEAVDRIPAAFWFAPFTLFGELSQ